MCGRTDAGAFSCPTFKARQKRPGNEVERFRVDGRKLFECATCGRFLRFHKVSQWGQTTPKWLIKT